MSNWALIQPLATMLLFSLIFGRLAKIPSDGFPYPIFVYAGLLPWTFFANALSSSSNSLVGQQQLISKVYFPRLIIPLSSVGSGLVDFAISSLIMPQIIDWVSAIISFLSFFNESALAARIFVSRILGPALKVGEL